MERKKTNKANLESKKGIFLMFGFVVTLSLVLLAFEWTTRPEKAEGFQEDDTEELEQDDVPVTRQEQKKEPPPPPKTQEVINIVDDDVEIEDELVLEETEADQDTEVSTDAFAEEEEEEEEEKVFVRVENMPEFRGGGINSFRKWVQQNLDYPNVAAENGIEGTVYVRFVVDTDGSITNVQVLRSVDPSLDEEAIATVKSAPEWEPGSQRGKPVRVQFNLPIVFQLQ
ncbi:MAG: energy transducer TonB [Bacteroidota bacterium]